jgi:hypothetical protein
MVWFVMEDGDRGLGLRLGSDFILFFYYPIGWASFEHCDGVNIS